MYDVIVVGGGPSGSTVAKRCAQYGLNTLLLEKKRLPRNKVCSGMVLKPVAHTLIKHEFGDLPETLLCHPKYLSGIMFHIPGLGSQKVDILHPLTWRRDLDYWMNEKAQAMGAEIWQETRVIGVREEGPGFFVTAMKNEERVKLETRFVVGAEGAISIVRKSLFPGLKMTYVQAYQEHYLGQLDLDKKYFHSFRILGSKPDRFGVIHKDDLFILSYGGEIGQIKGLVERSKDSLFQYCHFDRSQKLIHKEGCLEPILYKELLTKVFMPAKGNALLIGDAGGFIMPVILEGIGLGIKSGQMAANSIAKSVESGKQAEGIYLSQVEDVLSMFKSIQPLVKRIAEETEKGNPSLLDLLCEACNHILKMYES